jgi:hypothetical protein
MLDRRLRLNSSISIYTQKKSKLYEYFYNAYGTTSAAAYL